MKITKEVKSGVYESVIWGNSDDREHFFIKVSLNPQTKALRDVLNKQFGEPMCVYYWNTGSISAHQWRLQRNRARALWNLREKGQKVHHVSSEAA